MATLKIIEDNQNIISCELETFVASNEFIRELVATAQANGGEATGEHSEGCHVIAIIMD